MKHIFVAAPLIMVVALGIAYAGWAFAVPVMIFSAVIIPALVPSKTSK
jgi:hypothetical protein